MIQPYLPVQHKEIIKHLRKKPELCLWFVEHAVSYAVGRTFNKQVKNDVEILRVMNAGDEAGVLLLLENSWEHWREQYTVEVNDSEQ